MHSAFPTLHQNLSEEERAALFDAMMESSLDAVVGIHPDGTVVEWNGSAERIFGYSRDEVVGRMMHDLIVPDEHVARHVGGLSRIARTGVSHILGRRIEIDAVNKAGHRFPIELAISRLPLRGETYFISRIRDIEGRKRYEHQLELVARELDHRVKNTLAILLSIARQTADAARDIPDFLEAYEARVLAYKGTHELLAVTQYKGVDLRALLLAEMAPHQPAHVVTLDGPEFFISPRGAVSLGMCIHEMTTNAIKYGALSAADGRIDIAWWTDAEMLTMTWVETGGPDPGDPVKRGFGSRLIKTALQLDLKGRFVVDYPSSGLVGRVEIPLESLGAVER